MSGSKRGRRHGLERERWKERQEREKKERKRDRDGREKDRDRSGREREIGRETGENEKKITKTKKFMEFYLVVLYPADRSEARQWIVARQVSCYNPLSCFNTVTRDKVGKKKIERETGWERERERVREREREKDITRGDRNGPGPLRSPYNYKSIL